MILGFFQMHFHFLPKIPTNNIKILKRSNFFSKSVFKLIQPCSDQYINCGSNKRRNISLENIQV